MNIIKTISAILAFAALQPMWGAVVKYQVSGLSESDQATVSLGSTAYLSTAAVSGNGEYEFKDVPEGEFQLKISAPGYKVSDSEAILVSNGQVLGSTRMPDLVLTPLNPNPDHWEHEWRQDNSVEGVISTSHILSRPEIIFLGKETVPANVAYFSLLWGSYNIILSDEEEAWTQEYAYRLVETLKTLPSWYSRPTKFLLTSRRLGDDLSIEKYEGGDIVTISKDAFAYANPFIVNIDGTRGRFYSKRLHHALTKFVSDFGKDRNVIDRILEERFGVSVNVPDYEALTAGQTDETAESFQQFSPSELVAIINMLEELPAGFHKTPHLNYLLRRRDGMEHPANPTASGISWCVDNGYIEFMNNPKANFMFEGNNESFESRCLILHEKVHFLWNYMFSQELQSAWCQIGGWKYNSLGWATGDEIQLLPDFQHAIDPEEDMAVCIVYYLNNPEKLRNVAPEKYEFIQNRIMHGVRYMSSIPEHLTFEVLNLYPEYDFQGKIRRMHVSVDGAPDEDKTLTVWIELNPGNGILADASEAYIELASPQFDNTADNKQSQIVGLYLYPDETGKILRGSTTVSKYAKNGLWTCRSIQITDTKGNVRYDTDDDCVTNVYINNIREDLLPPAYVSGSIEYGLSSGMEQGHPVKILKVRYKVNENTGVASVVGRLSNDIPGWYCDATDGYGTFNQATGKAEIEFIIPEFCPAAYYHVEYLTTTDLAGSSQTVNFSENPGDEPVKRIWIQTGNPDTEAPEIDLNRITVYAEPTHPDYPDGETLVSIDFYCRDNISGVGMAQYRFRDPFGTFFGPYWFYHDNFYGLFYQGEPTVWTHYTITHILPAGSTPGLWGLESMILHDKAGNERIYNFVETLIFEPEDSNGYVLSARISEPEIMELSVTSDTYKVYGYAYRIIHDKSGQEISGEVAAHETSPAEKRIDISRLDPGELSVFVTIKDQDGKPVSVKSKKLTKQENILTGMDPVSETGRISIIPSNGRLNVSGTAPDEKASVRTLTGTTLFNGNVKDLPEITFDPGFYIVTVKGLTSKVMVR